MTNALASEQANSQSEEDKHDASDQMPPNRGIIEPVQGELYVSITLIVQTALDLGLVLFILRRDWENIFLTLAVIGLTVFPAFVLRRYRVYVPPEFQLIAAAFVFLTLFLGSARNFYYRFWWWDMVLH